MSSISNREKKTTKIIKQEVFFELKDYMKKVIIPNNIKKIKLDIGLSYNAPVSQNLLKEENDVFVFGFEPLKESYEGILSGNIVKKSKKHGEPLEKRFLDENRIFLLPFALNDKHEESEVTFFKTLRDVGCSSLFEPKDKREMKNEKTTVKTTSLKNFFDLFDWDRFSYIEWIKIDAQGSDLNILKGAENYLKDRVVYVTAEGHGGGYHNAEKNIEKFITEYMISQNFIKVNHPNTQDPTYLNKKFIHLKDKIYLDQRS